jgi:hypothetical protein
MRVQRGPGSVAAWAGLLAAVRTTKPADIKTVAKMPDGAPALVAHKLLGCALGRRYSTAVRLMAHFLK